MEQPKECLQALKIRYDTLEMCTRKKGGVATNRYLEIYNNTKDSDSGGKIKRCEIDNKAELYVPMSFRITVNSRNWSTLYFP